MIDKQIEVDMEMVHKLALARARDVAIGDIAIRYIDGRISVDDVVDMMHDIDNDPRLHITASDYYPEVITDILLRSGSSCIGKMKNLHRVYND